MKKKKKAKIYFSLDSDINTVFEKHIEENIIDKTKLIELLVIDYLKNKGLIK